MHKIFLLLWLLPTVFWAQKPTQPQLAWHQTEFYLFLHFGPNTFTNMEWGQGTETEDMFNPTAMDCDQWCRVAKAAGAKGIVITAKHHDGFCLWPSAYSKHTVRESKWKNGKGDVLRELSDACKRNGLKLGFYLSPWDRNHPKYGTAEYNNIYVNTMKELMTQYGDLFEFWWDGANGEGSNGKKQVYDFHRFEKEAAKMQPSAVIFSDIGPGCRWAGNEQGTVSETNWCTLDTVGFSRGNGGPSVDSLQQGNINGTTWIPAECDVSIRPGWFYHQEEDDKVKTPDQLFDIWMKSVGRGANLILNVPPDRRGRIHPNDSVALVAFGQMRAEKFAKNLAKGLVVQSGSRMTTRVTDENPDSSLKMSTNPGSNSAEVHFLSPQPVHFIRLEEFIAEGQSIAAFAVDIHDDTAKTWKEVLQSTTIGARKILAFKEGTVTSGIRVRLLKSKGIAKLSEWKVY
jgi:alpha-L-fucosidase